MLNTATAYLAMLEEDDDIKSIALDRIERLVDGYWAEISDYITDLESLYTSNSKVNKDLVALILSKLYYNLEDYDSAIDWALKADTKFNISDRSLYVTTILRKIIDKYIFARKNNYFNKSSPITIDQKVEKVVNEIFNKCISLGEYNQAIGLSIESYDTTRLTSVIEKSGNVVRMLKYTYEISQELVFNNEYRNDILQVILLIFAKSASTEYLDITLCQFLLNNSGALGSTLIHILKNEVDPSIAYQIGFDIYDSQNPNYLKEIAIVVNRLGDDKELNIDPIKLKTLKDILQGNVQTKVEDLVLKHLNKSDTNIMKNLMKSVDKSGAVCHLGVIIANSFMNSHTRNDKFLKENLEWVSKATNWARFTATASLGAIHMGNKSKGYDVIKPYMPGGEGVPSIYTQAGSYYGLGLIFQGSNDEVILGVLVDALNAPTSTRDIMQHGIYLGIGLVAMGTHNPNLYEKLRDGMYTDDAISGEAAALSIGLIMIGAGAKDSQAIEDLVTYAHDTHHEKIVRAIAMALAMIVYGTEENADSLIEQLSREKDPILRYGAMYCIGMAYAGTANNDAFRKLIKFSVSDGSDDVRRAALINIGFLHIKNPEILLDNLKVLSLLSESYNPQVRYGAAMALGISCAGSGLSSAYKILEPLFNDSNYLVRQGSMMAAGMIYSHVNATLEPKVTALNEELNKNINDKDEHSLVRFGAILSQGLLELGGRNCVLSLVSQNGSNRCGAIIGTAIFTQYYYWFPFTHFINLAVTPCLMVGVDSTMKVVRNFNVKSKAKPSIYSYPKEVQLKEKIQAKKTEAVVLSTLSRVKAKTSRKMDIVPAETKKEEVKEEEKPKEKEPEEPTEEILQNPCRIIPRQYNVIEQIPGQSFVSVVNRRHNGFVMLRQVVANCETKYLEDELSDIQIKPSDVPLVTEGKNEYSPLPKDDVEMPEEFSVDDLKKK